MNLDSSRLLILELRLRSESTSEEDLLLEHEMPKMIEEFNEDEREDRPEESGDELKLFFEYKSFAKKQLSLVSM